MINHDVNACALNEEDMRARLAEIAELNRVALLSSQREGARLRLSYNPAHRTAVKEMLCREEECCAFLKVAVDEAPGLLSVIIDAPGEAGSSLLQAFSARAADPAPACACCAEVRT